MPKELNENGFGFQRFSFLKIPSISLKGEICEFSKEVCLNEGIWVKYKDEKNNILLTGHSFSILPLRAGVFYNLGNIEVGEKIYVELEENFVYIVSEVFVTSRYDLFIEDFSELEETLVLYSCFPVWSASERIVVRARICNLCENEI